jgi:hypothetical protein
VDFSKQDTAILHSYVLTPGARYVPTLNSTVRLRNTREAHREHLRLWAKLLRCKEYHEASDIDERGFRADDNYYRVQSYTGGYRILRVFDYDYYGRPRLLDIMKIRCPISAVKGSYLMRFFPAHNDDWIEYASKHKYGSNSKTISFDPGHASVYASNVETYSFPMLEQLGSSTYDSLDKTKISSRNWRRYRID